MNSLDCLFFRERTYINDHSARDTLLKGSERLDNKQKPGETMKLMKQFSSMWLLYINCQSNYCSPGELNASHQII